MTIGQKTSMKWKKFLKNPKCTQEEIDKKNIPTTEKENAPTSSRSPSHMEGTRRSPLPLNKEKATILLGPIREGRTQVVALHPRVETDRQTQGVKTYPSRDAGKETSGTTAGAGILDCV